MAFKEPETEIQSSKLIVLAVHNLYSNLPRLKKVFEEKYTIHTASGGTEALKILREIQKVDILIVNQNMPEMRGTEFFRVIQETQLNPEKLIKMLIMAPGDHEDLTNAHYFGHIDSYYTKPFDPEHILVEINRLVAKRSKEKRASLRINFPQGKHIEVDIGLIEKAQLDDISENGMFLRTKSGYAKGKTLPFTLHLSDGERHLVGGRVVRMDWTRGGIGIEFRLLDEQSRRAIFSFLSDYVTLQDLSELKEMYPFLRVDDMIAFRDKKKIEALLMNALQTKVDITALSPQMSIPVTMKLESVEPGVVCIIRGKDLDVKFKTSDHVFISFQAGYATYSFETTIRRITAEGTLVECFFPRVMFYSEKRSIKRESLDGTLSLEISLPAPFHTKIGGRITDISDGGASFISEANDVALLPGTPLESVKIFKDDTLVREERGEVRNVVRSDGTSSRRIRYGVQFGIGRLSIQTTKAPKLEFDDNRYLTPDWAKFWPGSKRQATLKELARKQPDVIRLENTKGEEIVGLLNSSFPLDERPVPVVIIPPAFGKTKETLFGLALTLIQNFNLLGKPLAVIRFDGIRRKGESHKDPEASEPPYEMINATFSQGAADIKAVLDWIQLNPKLKASSVSLVTFSFSALDARLMLRDDYYRHQVNYWISCMGTPEFRHLMIRINCGLDFLENYQLGIKLGVMPVLGNLVNVDQYVGNGVINGVATLDQARDDMRHIDIPITWIYGEHDHWIEAGFIRDVMSVRANAPREVISVPIGHNARTSKDALRFFGTITSLIHRFFCKEMIPPIFPSKEDMDLMRRAEKDRIVPRKLKNREDYWQRYLVGEENHLGYDIMALGDDYKQLMRDQMEALELAADDDLLDLGGGTGNFIEHILGKNPNVPRHMTIADLVPGGLHQALKKLAKRSDGPKGTAKIDALCCDIELNRYLPVRRFLQGEMGRFEELVDKVENLTFQSAEKIQAAYSPRLHRILRGEAITSELEHWLRSQFELPEYRVIIDFNLASRHVRGLTTEKPAFRTLVFSGNMGGPLHLPVKPGVYNKILMSLVLSYIFNPVETLHELRRIIRPGGLLVLSSMRPDTDASGPFTRLMDKIESMPAEELPAEWPKALLLESLRFFLNDAQALVDLEEAGTFDFFDPEKLDGLLEEAGWETIRTIPSFGDPPQGYVVLAKARRTNG